MWADVARTRPARARPAEATLSTIPSPVIAMAAALLARSSLQAARAAAPRQAFVQQARNVHFENKVYDVRAEAARHRFVLRLRPAADLIVRPDSSPRQGWSQAQAWRCPQARCILWHRRCSPGHRHHLPEVRFPSPWASADGADLIFVTLGSSKRLAPNLLWVGWI